ncbi:hypothetical protein SHLO109777_06190 [Shewanella loihica]|uniref:Uncharacterized protein n=1 Tax=Shewanella loihica (strain ATCC BAA-1088 / PV-4) TaxID=323850 RepID=A3QGT7_SHELP|nr:MULTISPECIES: hypothetical protein [Shewanella]ABO24685.1 hypothetical protein Shew_2819 [Shewanella loihica PV-4]QYJ84515.1 hypothetical protein K0H80_14395 [Shewanella aegiceratis]
MIVKWWRAYIAWCDRMGLTPENQRCCAPKLSDPHLDKPKLDKPKLGKPELDKPELKDSNLSSSFQEVREPQQALQESKESQVSQNLKAKADDVSRR